MHTKVHTNVYTCNIKWSTPYTKWRIINSALDLLVNPNQLQ